MAHVLVLSTGGTIAMQHDVGLGGAVPRLGAAELTGSLPPELAEVEITEVVKLPSSHFGLETLWEIRNAVKQALARPEVDGVVVTHGTDVLEETAMLLDLTVNSSKPAVLTGAMRAATQIGYEGYANLADAVRVAANLEARNLGTLVVLNGEVHAARFVTKTHTLSLETFQSPPWGPIGRIEGERVIFGGRVRRHFIDCPVLETRVELIKLTVGAQPDFLQDALERGVRGVVIEALGGGRVPPWWFPVIKRAIAAGVTIVVGSRCPAGRVWDPYGYPGAVRDSIEAGCLLAEGLNGQKARIKLMVVLGVTQDPDRIAWLWYAEEFKPKSAKEV